MNILQMHEFNRMYNTMYDEAKLSLTMGIWKWQLYVFELSISILWLSCCAMQWLSTLHQLFLFQLQSNLLMHWDGLDQNGMDPLNIWSAFALFLLP